MAIGCGSTRLGFDFNTSRIRPVFSGCGRSVVGTLEEIRQHRLDPNDLPPIQVIVGPLDEIDGLPWYFSLNNRRLWVLKQCRKEGLLLGRDNDNSNKKTITTKFKYGHDPSKAPPNNSGIPSTVVPWRPSFFATKLKQTRTRTKIKTKTKIIPTNHHRNHSVRTNWNMETTIQVRLSMIHPPQPPLPSSWHHPEAEDKDSSLHSHTTSDDGLEQPRLGNLHPSQQPKNTTKANLLVKGNEKEDDDGDNDNAGDDEEEDDNDHDDSGFVVKFWISRQSSTKPI